MKLVELGKGLGEGADSGAISDENPEVDQVAKEDRNDAKWVGSYIEFFEIGAEGKTGG